MEERSPGSYRINIRGSSLRSPFGVRNVKVYWNDIPITDAGGNTYFNQFTPNNFSYINVNKGPAGSMYGAGTGGMIQLHSLTGWKPGLNLEILRGNYGLETELASFQFGKREKREDTLLWQSQHAFTYTRNEVDGYRDQSAMRRKNFSWESKFKISDKQELRASVLYADLFYETPGGLTYTEFQNNPKAARPAAGIFPSAEAVNAAIYQKTFTAGVTNLYQILPSLSNRTTVYGSYADVKNSAIRNYERRKEPGFGGRSVFIYRKNKNKGVQGVAGIEYQKGFFNTQVFSNANGNPDTLQTNDDIEYTTYSIFWQADYTIRNRWFFLAGLSLNKTQVEFTRLSARPIRVQEGNYPNELAPRFSVRREFRHDFHISAILSRGFSPPTIAELLPSTGTISTDLEAEYGWNREINIRKSFFNNRVWFDMTGYYFTLKNALVQRRDLSGADFFVNAGSVKQKGIETSVQYFQTFGYRSPIDYLNLTSAFTYNHFRYGEFIRGSDDFSGKTVPSVPAKSLSITSDLRFKNGFYLNALFYTASRIYLNDANTASASPYEILGGRIGWRNEKKKSYTFDIYLGGDNLLNETYSLGNDINAAAGRYFNAAMKRHWFLGVAIEIRNKK